MHAADGRITALLGPNGAGKTTTLRMVAALLQPDSGRIEVDGIDVAARPREALARLGVLSDARGLYPRLTARENIVYHAQLHGMPIDAADERAQALAQLLELSSPARSAHRRLQPGRAHEDGAGARAGARPAEPHPRRADQRPGRAGHSRPARRRCASCATSTASASSFAPTSCRRCERLCDHVVVVAQGRAVAEGSVDELCRRSGHDDFEQAFVALAFAPGGDGSSR